MLKYRLATAIVLIPLVLYLLFASSVQTFYYAMLTVAVLAAWEWPTLMGKNAILVRLSYVAAVLVIVLLSHFFPARLLLALSFLSWCIFTYWVLHYPAKQAVWVKTWALSLIGLVLIVPLFIAFIYLRTLPHGHELLLILLLLIWGADSSAYFIGRRFGRNKLIPQVSPNKSWQGFYAAISSGFLLAVMAIIWLNDVFATQWFMFIVLAMLTTIASIVGDLAESMFKRAQGVKDSGALLPGHGGILDRIDSLTAAAPIYTLGLILLGIK
jgi:phosphatidate cytidylyltransferase